MLPDYGRLSHIQKKETHHENMLSEATDFFGLLYSQICFLCFWYQRMNPEMLNH